MGQLFISTFIIVAYNIFLNIVWHLLTGYGLEDILEYGFGAVMVARMEVRAI